jgi:radical SAM protein with 4Fe4S-binding SPASM domain
MFEELRIEVNKPCNFACVHCYTDKHGPPGLPVEDFLQVIKEVASRGATDLSLTGGEPLLAGRRSLELIEAGAASGLRVRLNTNGFLLDEGLARQLKEAGLTEVQISLNSAEASDFDSFVQKQGAFEGVQRAVRASVDAGLFVSMRFTLMLLNCTQLVSTFRLAEAWGCHKFKVRALVQVNGIRESGWSLEQHTLQKALNELVSVADGSTVEVSIADDGLGITPAAESNCRKNFCKCGDKALFVAADGQISPCPFLREETEYKLGNLKEDDLMHVYDTSMKLKEFIGNRVSELGGNDCEDKCKASVLASALNYG